MTFDWSRACCLLGQVRIIDYFRNRSMPVHVEPLVGGLVESFASSGEVRQRQMLSAISAETSSVLGWYARKLAGRSVRDDSRADVWNGLVAIAMSASKGDVRDGIAPLALLHNSALHLREDPKPLFEAASKMSTQPVMELFEGFLNSASDAKSIAAFGFSEGMGPHGFDYVPLLPEYGGPVPF